MGRGNGSGHGRGGFDFDDIDFNRKTVGGCCCCILWLTSIILVAVSFAAVGMFQCIYRQQALRYKFHGTIFTLQALLSMGKRCLQSRLLTQLMVAATGACLRSSMLFKFMFLELFCAE